MGLLDDLQPASPRIRPTSLSAEGTELVIDWSDGRRDRLPMLLVRARCPCASCVDEWSGKRLLNVTTLQPDVAARRLTEVGRYAVQVGWSDGHDTGIYSWELLRALGDEHARRQKG